MKTSLGIGTRFTRHRPPGRAEVSGFSFAVAAVVMAAATAAVALARCDGYKEI